MDNDEQQRQFNEFLEQAGRLSPDVVATMAAISALSGPINKTRYSFNDAEHEVRKFQKGTSDLTAAQIRQLQGIVALNTAMTGLTNTARSFNSALNESSTDLNKFNNTFKTIGNSAMEIGNIFGNVGKAAGVAFKALTVAGEAIMDYNTRFIKAYDELAETGATLKLTTTDIRDFGAEAGYSTKTLGTFVKTAKSLDNALIGLGGSASGGIKAFGQIAAIGEDQYIKYRKLGISQEQVTEMQAKFVKQTVETGGALAKTPKQLQQESLKYIDTLNVMAEITGVNAKKQQEAMELALQQENVNAFIFQLEKDRAEATTQAEKERIQKQIDSTRVTAANIVATNDAATAAAKLESITTKTGMVYTENNAKLVLSGQNYDKINEMLRKGEDPALIQLEMMRQSAQAAKSFSETYGESAFANGKASRELQETFGITNKVREQAIAYDKFSKMSADEQKKELDKLRKSAETGGDGKPKDNLAAAQAEYESGLRKINLGLDKAVDAFNPFTGSAIAGTLALGGLAAAAFAASLALSKISAGFGGRISDIFNRNKPIGPQAPTTGGKPPSTPPTASGGTSTVKAPAPGSLAGWQTGPTAIQTIGTQTNPATIKTPEQIRADKLAANAEAARIQMGEKPGAVTTKPVSVASAKPIADIAGDAAKIAEVESAAAKAAGATSKLATAGSLLGKLAGPLATVTSVVGGGMTAYQGVNEANRDLAEGKITKGDATVKKSEAVGTGTGQVVGGVGGAALGGSIGTAAGGALGALFGGVGAVPGAMLGGVIGTALGGWLGSSGGEKLGKAVGKEVGEKIKTSDQAKEAVVAKEERDANGAEKMQLLETEKLYMSKVMTDELQTLSKNIEILNKSMTSSTNQLLTLTRSITNLNTTLDFSNADSATQIKKFEEIANKLGLSQKQIDEVKKKLEESASKQEGGKPIAGDSKEFYNKIYATLLEEAKKAKVANPEAIARLGAAQSSLETGYGKSTAGGNNYFGIKGKAGDTNVSQVDTQEWDPKQGKMVTVKAGFRKYGSMQESAADYIKFLQENPRYKDVLNAKTTQEAIQAQGKTGYATDPNYASKLASINARGTASEAPPVVASSGSQPTPSSATMLADAGLKIKKGDVQAEGAGLDPRLIEIAKQVQASVPGFVQFTGFNDQFHQENSPGSLHAKGRAFDFVVGKKPSREEGAQIVDLMKSLGIDYAIDEYNNPSAKATAGHFHGQLNETMKAYDGGIFDGPKSGFNVELHGREAVVPLPNPESVISVEDKGVKKDALSTAMADVSTQVPNIQLPGMDQLAGITEAMMRMMEDKFDSMISKLENGNDIQEKIYRNSAS